MSATSIFLEEARPVLRDLVDRLGGGYDFLSVLGTDCGGTNFEALPGERRAAESLWTERGFVVRAIQDGAVAERSPDRLPDDPDALQAELDALLGAGQTDRPRIRVDETAG